MPAPFTMNWKFDAPGEVVFKKGEPFCFFQLIQPQLNIKAQPILRKLTEAPEFQDTFQSWSDSRKSFNDDLSRGCPAARDVGWQKSLINSAKKLSKNSGQGVTKIRLNSPQQSKHHE